MSRLTIKRDDLIDALTFRFEITEGAFYLDSQTGEILLVSDAADEVPEDIEDNPRYIEIEPIPSDESYRIMEDFVATLSDAVAAKHLTRALNGRKPFRRFKDALLEFPQLREGWFEFEAAAYARLAQAWCEERELDVQWSLLIDNK
jgi:Uncharacterised protein family (UPF0158)